MKSIQSFFMLSLAAGSLLLDLCACKDNKEKVTEKTTATAAAKSIFDKLTGTWYNESDGSFEQWTKKEDGNYQSRVFTLSGNDTAWKETAAIYPEKDKWAFETMVAGQNDGRAVKFLSVVLNELTVQFSNPTHDFPTDINYTIADDNTVNAFIAGPDGKGGKDTIAYHYKRIN